MPAVPPNNRAALPHLEFHDRGVDHAYKSHKAGGGKKLDLCARDAAAHGAGLRQQLANAKTDYEAESLFQQPGEKTTDYGLILEITGEPGFHLKFESFERGPSGIELLNARSRPDKNGQMVQAAAVFVPYGKLEIVEKLITAYSQSPQSAAKPKNAALLANVDSISLAALEALWTEDAPLPPPNEERWWELWIRRLGGEWETRLEATCAVAGLELRGRIQMPEHVVRLVRARREQLSASLPLLNCLAEIRQPRVCSLRFTEMSGVEQQEWVQEAVDRLIFPDPGAPAVCILDTGINRGHPMLSPLLPEEDMHTVDPPSGTADHPLRPHGTPMAGLAAFGPLGSVFASTEAITVSHWLESVKLLKNSGDHEPELYGDVTRQAVAYPESTKVRDRVFCMAIAGEALPPDGSPSSWSAALDSITAASDPSEGEPKPQARVFFVAAGNCINYLNYQYPDSLYSKGLLDPAQSWNAITVGGMTDLVTIDPAEEDAGYAAPIAAAGGLSPSCLTSVSWHSQWPFKPDIVMEAGNMAIMPDGDIWPPHSLRVLSTGADVQARPITTFGDTSAATAQAARLGGMLRAAYPHYWPETIRALVIHSARWTKGMLGNVNPHEGGQSAIMRKVLRSCGFGRPDATRALHSSNSETTVVLQNELQPFHKVDSDVKTKCLHLHHLPWPLEIMSQAGNDEATLRVTLSYFIEPNPGSRAVPKFSLTRNRYRYPGCALRFEMQPPGMSSDVFHAKLNAEIEAEDADLETGGFSDSRWALGTQLRRNGGSVHHDVWQGPAADLALMGQIAVIPIKGWWAFRKFPEGHECHNCHERSVRYSLVVSVEIAGQLPVYQTIQNLIAKVPVPVEVEVAHS